MRGKITDISLEKFGNKALKEYGSTVLKDRAIPSLYDGLKPVQRRILYAMHNLKLSPNAKPQKAARVSGNTLGLYHPHGNVSVESAMETMVNSPTSFIDGCGSSWGTIISGAAAPRYIECRLSKWTFQNFFDSDYSEAFPKIPNYDGQTTEPLYLPSKTMSILVNGSYGLAVGSTSHIPSFTTKSVAKLITKALQSKKKLTARQIAGCLEFNTLYGGWVKKTKENKEGLLQIIKTGRGRIKFSPKYTIKGKVAIVTGLSMSLQSGKILQRITLHPDVDLLTNKSTIEHPIMFEVVLKSRIKLADAKGVFESVLKPFSEYKSFRLTYLKESQIKTKIKKTFREGNMIDMLYEWIDWRQQLELNCIQNFVDKLQKELTNLEFLIFVFANRNTIDQCRDKNDPVKFLLSKFDIDNEDVGRILNMSIRQLCKIQANDAEARKKEIAVEIKSLHRDTKTKRCNKRITTALE